MAYKKPGPAISKVIDPTISIRKLNSLDCGVVAEIHTKAFPSSSLTKLGHKAVRRYYSEQMVETNECLAVGAFHENVMIGFIYAGVFHGVLNDFLRKNRVFLALRVVTHPWLVLDPMFRDAMRLGLQKLLRRRQRPTTKANYSNQPFVVLSIAVDPHAQHTGVGLRLMAYAEEQAIRRGFEKMALTVNVENAQAIRFYEKNGWVKQPGFAARNMEMVKYLDHAALNHSISS